MHVLFNEVFYSCVEASIQGSSETSYVEPTLSMFDPGVIHIGLSCHCSLEYGILCLGLVAHPIKGYQQTRDSQRSG